MPTSHAPSQPLAKANATQPPPSRAGLLDSPAGCSQAPNANAREKKATEQAKARQAAASETLNLN